MYLFFAKNKFNNLRTKFKVSNEINKIEMSKLTTS